MVLEHLSPEKGKFCRDTLLIEADPDNLDNWQEVYCELPPGHKGMHQAGVYEWNRSILEKMCGYEIYGPQGLIGICDRKAGHSDGVHQIKGKYGVEHFPVQEGY